MTSSSSFSSTLAIAQPNPDGSLPVPAVSSGGAAAASTAAQWEERAQNLQAQVDNLQEILAKPLSEILADREKSQEVGAAWDAFGAMWMLSQRAMRRVALDLAAKQGVDEADVVARAMAYANSVLNGDEENLDGSIAPAQMAHIARHRSYLRKQFRPG